MTSIKNKRILVLGGAGDIGKELVSQLAPKNKIFVFDIDETRMFDLVEDLGLEGRVGNVRDIRDIEETFDRFNPNLVFHAAALKHVSPSEIYPVEATKTNVLGTHNVVLCCKRNNAKLVNISTDKVVNGGVMGATKKIAEAIVREAGFVSVRFGNVMGSRGSVLKIWERQIKRGDPITVTDPEMERFMMTIPDAVDLVIKAVRLYKPGRKLIMDMGERRNIMEWAKEISDGLGGYPIKIIGRRPGEALTEELMTEEEKKVAKKIDNYWIIN